MTPLERQQKIESYGRAYEQLAAVLAELPRDMWDFRPSPEEWTIAELVNHIADSEANSYIRCRRGVAEPGQAVMSYDEKRWAALLHSTDQDLDEAVELFRLLRQRTYRLIRSLPEAAWVQTIDHPENGVMTLDDWLDVYERHIPEHVAQMRRVYAAWGSEGARERGSEGASQRMSE